MVNRRSHIAVAFCDWLKHLDPLHARAPAFVETCATRTSIAMRVSIEVGLYVVTLLQSLDRPRSKACAGALAFARSQLPTDADNQRWWRRFGFGEGRRPVAFPRAWQRWRAHRVFRVLVPGQFLDQSPFGPHGDVHARVNIRRGHRCQSAARTTAPTAAATTHHASAPAADDNCECCAGHDERNRQPHGSRNRGRRCACFRR
mmetsp:Transcript_105430/g.296758  ORF Transcript_105430/g.296758 Transcript_105430/m.296758 type:complete len:202 (+) Transcript_105430:1080-1685(+)